MLLKESQQNIAVKILYLNQNCLTTCQDQDLFDSLSLLFNNEHNYRGPHQGSISLSSNCTLKCQNIYGVFIVKFHKSLNGKIFTTKH